MRLNRGNIADQHAHKGVNFTIHFLSPRVLGSWISDRKKKKEKKRRKNWAAERTSIFFFFFANRFFICNATFDLFHARLAVVPRLLLLQWCEIPQPARSTVPRPRPPRRSIGTSKPIGGGIVDRTRVRLQRRRPRGQHRPTQLSRRRQWTPRRHGRQPPAASWVPRPPSP